MIRFHKINSKIYITRKSVAIAYIDFKRLIYVKAPTHFKDGFNIIITDSTSSNIRPDIQRIKDVS